MSRTRRLAILISAASTLLTLYSIELLFTLSSPAWMDRLGTALRKGPSVIAETMRARENGLIAYPFLQPDTYTSGGGELRVAGDTIIAPLSGIAGETTILCNESGITIAYRSDSLGFRNPPGTWTLNNTDVAMIGDSFAHGFCRPERETIAFQLRSAGVRTINAGLTGAGPLAELGVLREFVAARHPVVVLWLFYEGNDLIDLVSEAASIHRRYLDTSFTQHLDLRRQVVNDAIRLYSDSVLRAWRPPTIASRIRGFVTLRQLRIATGLYRKPAPATVDEQHQLQLLEQILRIAKGEVGEWGGTIALVYLPERRRFNTRTDIVTGENHNPRIVERNVSAIAARLGIPVVNVADAFAGDSDPAALWNNRRYHYNARGYAIAARSVLRFLQAEGPHR